MLMSNGDPGRIRTCDLRLRRPVLYPAELRDLTIRTRPYHYALGRESCYFMILKIALDLRGTCNGLKLLMRPRLNTVKAEIIRVGNLAALCFVRLNHAVGNTIAGRVFDCIFAAVK